MAAATSRLRSSLSLLSNSLRSQTAVQRSIPQLQTLRDFATASPPKEKNVKVPVVMFGGSGKFATALYMASVKANVLDKVETELLGLVEASKHAPKFSQFTKDLSVPKATRIQAIEDIAKEAKYSDITRNFLVLLAEKGGLKYIDIITKRFSQLTMAHRGEVKAVVTTIIPLPAQEEKELKEILQEVLGGEGKSVRLEQKIDPSILGGIVVEFSQKVFDMSIRTRAQQMERFLRDPVNIGSL